MTSQAERKYWKKGFEIELLAPTGSSRKHLADRIADTAGGTVHTRFYPQSEPSLVPGLPVFETLVLAFDVVDVNGNQIALFTDDLTLTADLNRSAPPEPGWMRILSDDARILALAERHCDPGQPRDRVLEPLAELFGTELERSSDGICKVVDSLKRSVAMAAELPGERDRPCEIITPPVTGDPAVVLRPLLTAAREMEFTIPAEAAVHVHFDAEPLCSAQVLSKLILALETHRDFLRKHLRTNPRCSRLGPNSAEILDLLRSETFQTAHWPEARKLLSARKPTKYCDFNLFNIAHALPAKHTFEVRILPGSLEVEEILAGAAMFECILNWAVNASDPAIPEDGDAFLEIIGLTDAQLNFWRRHDA